MENMLTNKEAEIQAVRIANQPGSNLVEHHFRTMVSFSHILGSITTILVDYIKSAFNEKYIKTIWNSMEVLYSQRSKAFLDVMLKPRPMMLIDPKFDPADESTFRPQREFDEFIANDPGFGFTMGQAMIDSRLICYYKNYKLYCKPRRYKMTFNVHFVFDSDMQRIQCQEYLRQTIRHNYTNVLYRSIENIIPDEYMKEIARLNHMDYQSQEFLDFVNSFTMYPITRRFRGGSGNIEFFWLVRTPVMIQFGDQSSEGPVKKGNIETAASFSENITIEFNAASIYFLVTAMRMGDPLYKDTISKVVTDDSDDTMKIVGRTYINLLDIPELNDRNFKKYAVVTLQADKNGTDTINIMDAIKNNELFLVVEHYLKNKLPISFIDVRVIENSTYLAEPRIHFDEKTFDLTINDMDVYNSYHIVVYADNKQIGDVLNNIYETDKYYERKDNHDID